MNSDFGKLKISIWPKAFVIVFGLLSLCLTSCKNEGKADYEKAAENPEFLHRTIKNYTDIIISDLFSPPVSSRNYVYSSMACYEVMRNLNPKFASLKGQLRDFPEIPALPTDKKICIPLAAIEAFHATGKKFIFSEADMEAKHQKILKEMLDLGIPKDVYDNSLKYGDQVAEVIKKYADGDNYKETRTMAKYTTTFAEGTWRPTPPDYNDALEPNWMKMRSFVFDSIDYPKSPPCLPFSKDKKSSFWDQADEIRAIGVALKPDQIAQAKFWDDNPVVSVHDGHAIHDAKKMTPAGHWMNINRQACEKAKSDILTCSESYFYVALGIYESFIKVFYVKYQTNLIRPESYINQYMDSKWKPFLQTPNFPEHTSGHSIISAASATMMTHVFGDNFAFIDSTENEYGHGVRSFKSFNDAAMDASISRVYGGIHYRVGCNAGNKHGHEIGQIILEKVKTAPAEEAKK